MFLGLLEDIFNWIFSESKKWRQKSTRGSKMNEDANGDKAWYMHQAYSRYWRHYHQAMLWQKRHKQAYSKAVQSIGCFPFSSSTVNTHRYSDWNEDDYYAYSDYCFGSGKEKNWTYHSKFRKGEDDRALDIEDHESETDEESETDSEIECDVTNMEITEELRQYFAQTEKHRKELKEQQQLEAEQHSSYMPADHGLHSISGRSAKPPLEKPGERRVAEMKKLYGEDAAKIQGMETAMQLTFDRNCDKKQPKYWPVIPLKL
ncbi:gem-associated protein 8 isoform X1 [Polypterus senegalus]|nr:gem-associated protein 8 isoform X1 [Polypterus senegalus]XP_039599532.1 gem-associated protein 8 isoform X1 [Polypterus senegalus]